MKEENRQKRLIEVRFTGYLRISRVQERERNKEGKEEEEGKKENPKIKTTMCNRYFK